jgi:signal peptidase I
MSGVSFDAEPRPASPLISVWLRPRQTIERIVTEQPRYLVLQLAGLGGAAGVAGMLVNIGVGSDLIGWRALLACILGGALLGIFNLYIFALVVAWVGRKIGGHASTTAVRAVFAWSQLPAILGLAIALAVLGGLQAFGDGRISASSLALILRLLQGIFALWSVVVILLMLSRVEGFGFWRSILVCSVGTLLVPLLLAFGVRTFLFQPFNIPSASMSPTLLVGDYFFASKYAYGYGRYSLPLSLPLFSGRIAGAEPGRGDVVVFRLKGGSSDYVKRVVGLPGDHIQMKEGLLYINGVPVQRQRLPDFVGAGLCGSSTDRVKRWRETLPNGVSYETLDCIDNGFYDNTNVYAVPSDAFFMLGDNRDNSTDSRVLSAVGYVPLQNIIGRVGMIFFSRAGGAPPSIRYERIGMMVR